MNDLKLVKKPMLLWEEDRHSKKLFPVECYGIRKVSLYGDREKNEVVVFSNGMEDLKTYGVTYRLWTLKPSEEKMNATEWDKKGEAE